MEDLERKKKILKAIKESLASISLEDDSLIEFNKITDDEIEKIYQKLMNSNKKYG